MVLWVRYFVIRGEYLSTHICRFLTASPVSRVHTRNPFQRHSSYDNAVAGFFHQRSASTPSPLGLTLSPSIIPLPSPTPDEMELETAP